MDLGLRGKVAIVTGSSDGIGLATARSLAREGARVVLCARRETLLTQARESIIQETAAEVLALTCDVQRLEDVKRLVEETRASLRRHPYSCEQRGQRASDQIRRCRRISVA